MKTTQRHHPAGRANSPRTVEVPANEHRALSEAQYEWPPRTLQNPDGTPLLTVAAALRGAADLIEEIDRPLDSRVRRDAGKARCVVTRASREMVGRQSV